MTLLYNGIQYEIEDEGEIEKINIGGEDDTDNDPIYPMSYDYEESAWEPKNVHLFLDECIKRKDDLRDPKIRRRRIFSDIRERMKRRGYHFRIESLDRKLRNMKIHYLVSRENNRKSLKRTHWPYYDKMKCIYPEESVSSRKRQAPSANPTSQLEARSSPPTSPRSTSSSPLPSAPPYKVQTLAEDEPRSSENYFPPDEQDQPNHSNYIEHPNKMESLRRQILCFEERRTIAAEKILNELRESNRLKRELLELNIKMFKAERDLEKH